MAKHGLDAARPPLAPLTELVSLRELTVIRDGRRILSVPMLDILEGERWALLGPNGSGKSTLLAVISGRLWPSSGEVTLLGQRLGQVDLRQLRRRLGLLSATLSKQLRPGLEVRDVVVTGIDGALEPFWSSYDEADYLRADELLGELAVSHLADKLLGVISEGERAQVLLARALISAPTLLCLDEPSAGLDLGARERLLSRLGALLAADSPAGVVMVTHHLEELPAGLSHVALLSEGVCVAAGPIDDVLSSASVSDAFAVDVEVTAYPDGRYSARAARRR